MNSCRQGLRNGVLVNPKLFILEKFNFGQPIKYWSNVFKLVLFGAGHYNGHPVYSQSESLALEH